MSYSLSIDETTRTFDFDHKWSKNLDLWVKYYKRYKVSFNVDFLFLYVTVLSRKHKRGYTHLYHKHIGNSTGHYVSKIYGRINVTHALLNCIYTYKPWRCKQYLDSL